MTRFLFLATLLAVASPARAGTFHILEASATYWTATDSIEIWARFTEPPAVGEDFIGGDVTLPAWGNRLLFHNDRDLRSMDFAVYRQDYIDRRQTTTMVGMADASFRGNQLTISFPLDIVGWETRDFQGFAVGSLSDGQNVSAEVQGNIGIDRVIPFAVPEPSSLVLALLAVPGWCGLQWTIRRHLARRRRV